MNITALLGIFHHCSKRGQMIPHVLLEISRRGECFRAKCAGVWLYLLMSHLVIVEVGGGREPFTAGLTLVGLLSCVNPPVCVETGAGGETFATNITDMGPLSRVDSDVSLEKTGSVKLLATGLTGQHRLHFPGSNNGSQLNLGQVWFGLRHRLTQRRMLGRGVAACEVEWRLRDDGLEVSLDQRLSQQLQGGQEEVGGGREEVELSHQLRPGLHLPHHLKHGPALL